METNPGRGLGTGVSLGIVGLLLNVIIEDECWEGFIEVSGANTGSPISSKQQKPILNDGVREVVDKPDFSVCYIRTVTFSGYCIIREKVLN